MNLVAWVLPFLVASAAFGDFSLHCRSNQGKYAAFVSLSSPSSGKVLIDDKEVEFGELVCTDDSQSVECASSGVADKGYSLLIEKGEDVFPGVLYTVSVGGKMKLAELTCHSIPQNTHSSE